MTALTASGLLIRLELRRNAMVWMLPVIAALFWVVIYRRAAVSPPVWSTRAMDLQTAGVSIFAPVVVGAGAWAGSREHRNRMGDLVACTARPRWARQLAAWVATTGWAVAFYVAGVGVVYLLTDRQGAWGGPLWWPAAVGVASVPAFSALGFAAGVVRPSRFTPPLVAVGVFFALEVSVQLIHTDRSVMQISPLVAGPWNLGPDRGLATFYPYLPDLPIAQLLFLGGLTAAMLGVLGVGAGSGGLWLRRSAAVVTAAGLVTAVAATVLAGTGRLDRHGMIAIPALHNAAYDEPRPYTPVCSDTPIPVCVHPVYAADLPTVAGALEPILTQLAGLPGAPVRINQASLTYRQETDNGISVSTDGPAVTGTPPQLKVPLPNQGPGPSMTESVLANELRTRTARGIVAAVIGAGRDATPAQQAIVSAILNRSDSDDPDILAAVRRFAALPAAARRAWLMANLDRLRSGDISLDELP